MRLRRAASILVTISVLSASIPTFAAPPAKKPTATSSAKITVPPEADALIQKAIASGKAGNFDEAVDLLLQALAIIEKKLGAEHYLLGFTLNLLAQIETIRGNLDAAEKYAERSIKVLKKDINADPLRLGHALIRRAEVYGAKGDAESEIEYRKYAILLFEKAFGAEGADAMAEILALARAFEKYGRYDDARDYFSLWLKVVEKLYGHYEPVLVDVLLESAITEMHAGRYVEADALLAHALEIQKKHGKTSDADIAPILNNMAEVAYQRGDYKKAESLYERVLAVYETKHGIHPQTLGIVLGNLGSVRLDLGDVKSAMPLLRRALEVQEQHFGPDHAALVTPLMNLGEALLRRKWFDESIPYLERALAIREKALGPNHPKLVAPLLNLGSARLERGDLVEAEQYLNRALSIQEKTLGPNHPLLFNTLQALGILHQDRKQWDQAEKQHTRALEVLEKAFGPTHPHVIEPLKSLAVLATRKGEITRAREALLRAGNVAEKNTILIVAGGSEQQKYSWLSTIEPVWSLTVEHHLRREPKSSEAATMAFEATLRRKGRALDAFAGSLSALRRRLTDEDRAILDKLRDTQKKLAAKTMAGPGSEEVAKWRADLESLGKQAAQLEREISERSATFRVENKPVSKASVQAMLPKDAIYIEIIRHHTGWALGPNEKAADQYTAYILGPSGDPKAVEIGEAGPIDKAVAELRKAFSDPARKDAKTLSRALDEKVMRPLRAQLGSSRRIILAPDGALDFIPFEAFVDEGGHYLIENYSLTYVTSGRDLLRWAYHAPSRSGPVVIANPDFGQVVKMTKEEKDAIRGKDATGLARVAFPPLSGTAEEAQAIAKQLPNASLFTEGKAEKSALSNLAGPKILHIATHGFFMGDTVEESSGTTRGIHDSLDDDEVRPSLRAVDTNAVPKAMPHSRSGLALAGANAHGAQRADGILTALEATGLDLEGTKLVVLSACETGLGKVKRGEGVEGLRRSFVLAGAETTVMSLWKVDDLATRDMMIGYYQRLDKGEARGEALRQVRLGMLANEATEHPFYWASFIVAGDPSRFDGTMPNEVPEVWPGKRGCACSLPGDSSDFDGAEWMLVMGAGAFLLRKRRARMRSEVA